MRARGNSGTNQRRVQLGGRIDNNWVWILASNDQLPWDPKTRSEPDETLVPDDWTLKPIEKIVALAGLATLSYNSKNLAVRRRRGGHRLGILDMLLLLCCSYDEIITCIYYLKNKKSQKKFFWGGGHIDFACNING